MAKLPQNPYSGVNPQSQLSPWNRFTDWLGITNNAGRTQYAHDVNSQMWQSEFDASMSDREYNSEQATAERMRQAGINPNMQSVQGGQSSLSGNSANTPLSQPDLSLTSFEQFISGAFNMAFSAFSGISQIANANLASDMSFFDTALSSAKRGIVGDFTRRVIPNDPKRLEIVDQLINGGLETYDLYKSEDLFKPRFRSRRARELFTKEFQKYLGSDDLRYDIIKQLNLSEDELKKLGITFSQTESALTDSKTRQFNSVVAALGNAQYEAFKQANRYAKYQNTNEADFQEGINTPSFTQSRVRSAQNELSFNNQSLDTKLHLNASFNKLVRNLHTMGNNGNPFANVALLSLYNPQATQNFMSGLGKLIL